MWPLLKTSLVVLSPLGGMGRVAGGRPRAQNKFDDNGFCLGLARLNNNAILETKETNCDVFCVFPCCVCFEMATGKKKQVANTPNLPINIIPTYIA